MTVNSFEANQTLSYAEVVSDNLTVSKTPCLLRTMRKESRIDIEKFQVVEAVPNGSAIGLYLITPVILKQGSLLLLVTSSQCH